MYQSLRPEQHALSASASCAQRCAGDKVQPGIGSIEELEVIAAQQLRSAFDARFADGRFTTATMANLAAYVAFTEPGDTIAILSPAAGSHASHQLQGTAGVRGLRVEYLPYDAANLDVDVRLLDDFMQSVKPKLLLVGGSVIQFPTNLEVLRSAADRYSARLVFDASHVAGLIAAGEFAKPLDSGVDLVTFSSYTTLVGPAGGAAVTNDAEVAERISDAWYPVLSSNCDPARLGPLAVAVSEAAEQQPAWARLTVELAKEIGQRLSSHGFSVQGLSRGVTESHQVVLDARETGGGRPRNATA